MKFYFLALPVLLLAACAQPKEQVPAETNTRAYSTDEYQYEDYLHFTLDHMDEHGHFISLIVTNGTEIKRLVIENGRLYALLTNYRIHKRSYRMMISYHIENEIPFPLTPAVWNCVEQNLLTISDTMSDAGYNKLVKPYLDATNAEWFPSSDTILRIAEHSHSFEHIVGRIDEVGSLYVNSFAKMLPDIIKTNKSNYFFSRFVRRSF